MRLSRHSIITLMRSFQHDQRGVSSAIVALLLVVMVGLAGLVIDFGRVYVIQRSLQASTDAAALAGGYNIPAGTATATANSYSAQANDKNANSNVTVTMVSGYPKLEYFKSTGIQPVITAECPSPGCNGIQVKEQAVVPTYFTRLAGISSVTVTATATAGAKGGAGEALNVMIVLDTTGSMSSSTDNGCGLGANATREQCALAGIANLLQGLNPSLDYVGLITFPGLVSSSDASYDYTCGKTLPQSDIQAYSNSPVYTIVGLNGSNNFKSSNTSKTLSANSDIVLASGAAGCTSGVTAPGGEDTYYAGAINAAQSALNTFAAPHTQNVIVFISDGGANSIRAQTDITGYISGTTLTVTGCPSGCAASSTTSQESPLTLGATITGAGVTSNTVIKAFGTGTGGTGTYTINTSQTVGSSRAPSSLTAANTLTFGGTRTAENVDQCQQAVLAAQAAAAAGTWVYSIAYGSSTATGSASTCTTDNTSIIPALQSGSANISSCTTMANIANSPGAMPDLTKFYSNNNNGVDCPEALASNTIENLVSLFQNLSENLTEPRLLPDNTN